MPRQFQFSLLAPTAILSFTLLLSACREQATPPAAAKPPAPVPIAAVEPPPDKFALVSTHGNVRCAWIDRHFVNDPSAIKGAALAIDAKDDRYCEILFWTDKKLVPRREWPMSDKQSDAVSITYFRNPKSGDSGLRWADGRELKW
jgi:hypothetical protein